jgi:VWFA-related protein
LLRAPLAAVLAWAIAVAPATTSVAQERPTFRVSTRLVEVSVVVHDSGGRPVPGLTASDFHLFDSGAEQRIELFASDGKTEPPGPQLAAARPAAAPGLFTNQVNRRGSATVVLFDKLNTAAADQLFARQNLVAFLKQIKPEDRVSVYVFDGRVHILHDFSNDTASLLRAVARIDAATSAALSATEDALADLGITGDPEMDAQFTSALARAERGMIGHFVGQRIDATTYALTAIANRLATVEGRKSLVWITSSIPVPRDRIGKSVSAVIQEMTRPLNDANVAVYPVDARGLVGAVTFGPQGRATFTTFANAFGPIETMQTTAEETGGRAFANTNDIRSSIRRAVEDGSATYTLGYYPSHGQWDGRYRRITVKVDRKGVDVRHRRGYFAEAASASGLSFRNRAIQAAVESPLEATGVALTARIERAAAGGAKVIVMITPSTITLTQSAGEWHGTIELVIAQVLPDGTTQRDVSRSLDLRMTPERYESVRRGGFAFDATIPLHPDVQRLHVIAHDVPTGRTGSIVIPRSKLSPPR